MQTAASRDEENQRGLRVVDGFYRAMRAKDVDAFAELWTADAVYRIPVTPDGVPGEFAGRDVIVAVFGQFLAAFGDVRITWDAEPMGDPGKVLATWTLEIDMLAGGTYRNRGASIFRLEGERIAEFTEYVDTAAFLSVFAAKTATALRYFELLRAKDIEAWGGLFHERGAITAPHLPEGAPSVIEGRDKIVAAYRELFAAYETFDPHLTGVHPAVNSDTVCVEYTVNATLANGTSYTNDNIAVLRFEDGSIVSCRDHADARRFKNVIDALPGTGA